MLVNGVAGFTALAADRAPHATPDSHPNIVFIMADDLGFGEVQHLNPERGKVPTPFIDQLAREGITFTDAHSGSSVCTPTRYGVITGRYAWRTRLQRSVVRDNTDSLIAPDRLTVGEVLRRHGYHTAGFGKWHLGFRYEEDSFDEDVEITSPDARTAHMVGWRVIDAPTTRGFDYYYGFHHSKSMSVVIENDRVVDSYAPIRMLPELARRSAAYVRQRAADAHAGTPFFLYVALNSPHSPVVPSPAFRGRSGLNRHADFVMETDWAVGEVMQAIEDTGLSDNTLIIFTSDNGTSYNTSQARRLEQAGHFPSGPFRGYKSDIWDGGHRVPFVARWPQVIPAGTRTAQLICLSDLMATVADIVEYTLADDAGEDSFSILPLLRGEDAAVRESVVHHSVDGRFAICTAEWKLILAPGSGGWSAPRDRDAAGDGKPPMQLYDMVSDYAETNNRLADYPAVVADLLAKLEQIVAAGRSTPGPQQANDVSVAIWMDPSAADEAAELMDE
jgi:arylsulfatase A